MIQVIKVRSILGNKELLHKTYIGQLTPSKPILSLHDVRKLGKTFNKNESTVKNLRTFHIDSGQNGKGLVLIIISKLQH